MTLALLLALAIGQTPAPTIEAHTGKSGSTIFVSPPITPVANPTLRVDNRSSLPLTAGPVSGGFLSFTLPGKWHVQPGQALSLSGVGPNPLPVRNSSGRVEWTIPDPTMGLGCNVAPVPLHHSQPSCPVKNWATRIAGWDAATTALDAAGLPTKLNGTSTAAVFSDGAGGNLIDDRGLPGLAGVYTVAWDSPDPLTVLSIESLGSDWLCVRRSDLSRPGTKGVGIVEAYQVLPTPLNPTLAPRLQVRITHPSGAPKLANLWIIPPGNDLDRSDPLAVERSFLDQMAIGAGRGPSILRWIDACAGYGGTSNIVEPGDLPDVSRSSWVKARRATAKITSIDPLDPQAEPVIQTIYGPMTAPKAAFQAGSRWLAQVTTAAPHGFATGQQAALSFPTTAVTFGGKPATITSFASMVWVTGPSSFLTVGYDPSLPSSGPPPELDLGVSPAGATATVTIPAEQTIVMPYEFAAAMTSQFRGAICWIPIPAAASDACVDAIAAKVLAHLGPTNKVIPEYSNELWNWGFSQWGYVFTMNKVTGSYYQIRRTAEITARFRAVFAAAGRSGDVLGVLASQFPPGAMGGLLNGAAKAGFQADVVAVAPYFAMPAAWAASTASWTSEQLQELMRHYLVLDPEPHSWWSYWSQTVARYEAAIGRRTLHYTYEGAVERIVPGGSANPVARTWDAMSHPDSYDTERVLHWQAQANGIDILTHYTHLYQLVNPSWTWGLYQWQGQRPGSGASNPRTGLSGVWQPGESPRGQAFRDWQRDYLIHRGEPSGSFAVGGDPIAR